MIDMVGLCSICGRPDAMFTCHLCGRLVCSNCYDKIHNVCCNCQRGVR